MIGAKVVYLLFVDGNPKIFANELDGIQLIFKPGGIFKKPVNKGGMKNW